MKTLIARLGRQVVPGLTLAALAATTTLHAQTAPPPSAPVSAQAEPQKLSAADLQDLLGPIALYPDALVSIILPASTVPSDIAMAVRYLNQNGDDANVDNQPWDASVRALAKYPDVLRWMDENLEWTTSLGEAFVVQPADVMNAVQELRLAAKDNGNLRNTEQQTVVVEKAPATQTETVREVIRIVPTDPEVIYVPVYDPQVVYVEPYEPDYVTPLITFGIGFAVGSWLNYDCDWYNDDIYWGPGCGWNNRNRWYDRGWNDGDVNVTNITNVNNITNIVNNNNGTQWQPNATARRYFERRQQQNIGNARVARANANIRQPSARELRDRNQRKQYLANRRERVAQPQRAKPITRNTAANRPKNAKATQAAAADNRKAADRDAQNRSAANRPADRPADRPKAQVQNDRPKAQGGQQGNRKKPTSPAPQLNGDNRTAKKPADRPAGKGNQNAANRQNKKPTQAPTVNADGSTAKPKKNTAKSDSEPAQSNRQASRDDTPRPKKPAPQASASKPKAQRQDADQPARPKKTQRPQVQTERPAPKHQQQVQQQQRKPQQQAQPSQRRPQQQAQQQQPQRRPQQQQVQQQRKPQQAQSAQRPKPQSGGQQSGNAQKKKKKDDDN
jgi:hypothetical protein